MLVLRNLQSWLETKFFRAQNKRHSLAISEMLLVSLTPSKSFHKLPPTAFLRFVF